MTITIEKICAVTGKNYSLEVEESDLVRWRCGELIQNVWPKLTPGEREFIKLRITPDEFDNMFPDEDDE